jgi:hypothetical protein
LEAVALLFSIVFVTPVVSLVFIGFYWSRTRDHDRLTSAWEAYARRRGHRFEAPSGAWPNRTFPSIAWTEESDAFRIAAHGAEKAATTRVIGRPSVAVVGELTVARSAEERKDGGRPFAAGLVVWDQPDGFAERVLTPEVKRALLGFDAKALSYRRGEVSLEWPGGEQNDARLDEASAVVRRVLGALKECRSLARGA